MDNQLVQDFNKLYFSKKQISRRVFDKEELEEIWENIELERKKSSDEKKLNFKDYTEYWYNNTDDIVSDSIFINEANSLEIFDYLSLNTRDNIKKSAEELEILELFRLENVELPEDIKIKILSIINENENIDSNFLCSLYNVIENKSTLNNEKNLEEYFNYMCRDMKDLYNLENLLKFINNEEEKSKIIKSATIYFYILVNKPFLSYNNLIAEIVSYKYLLSRGYEIFKYCTLSNLIKDKLKKYNSAIENSISSNGDITYFIRFYLGILRNAVEELNSNLSYKFGKKIIKELIEKNNVKLEDRQIKFINSALTSRTNVVTIDNYKKKLNLSYETSRSDLNYLVTLGVFKIAKMGKRYEYYMNDISTIIDNFEE